MLFHKLGGHLSVNEKIIVDYYQGAYGPTIYIETHSIDDLIQIKHMIKSIRNGEINEVSFETLKNVVITGFSDLLIRKNSNKKKHEHCIRILDNYGEGKVFLWVQTDDELEGCEFLIDGLIEGNSNGHQYLIEEELLVIELYLKLEGSSFKS